MCACRDRKLNKKKIHRSQEQKEIYLKITLPSSEALSGKPANVNAAILSSAESEIPKKRGWFKRGCTMQDFGLSNTKELSGPHLTVRQFLSWRRLFRKAAPKQPKDTDWNPVSFRCLTSEKKSNSSPGEQCRRDPTTHFCSVYIPSVTKISMLASSKFHLIDIT